MTVLIGVGATPHRQGVEGCQQFKGERWVLVDGVVEQDAWKCVIGVVYRGHNREEKIGFYKEFEEIISTLDKPVLLMGDFNDITHIHERQNQISLRKAPMTLQIGIIETH